MENQMTPAGQTDSTSRSKGVRHYFSNLLSDKNVASIVPSSKYAIERTCKPIDFARTETIVEYGPGGGCFTRYLLDHLPQTSRVIALDTNADFIERLKSEITDPRLTLLLRSAEDVLDVLAGTSADYIISGIPFSFLPPDVKRRVLMATRDALKPGGKFLTYQFFPPPASFDRALKKPMEEFFDVLNVEYEFRNIPPLRIYETRPKKA